jgi:5-methylcytosine-specific restriction protein A
MHQGEVRRHVTELTDKAAVLSAIAECKRLGQNTFLGKYGFREATDYILKHEGGAYDSKAIVGVAFAYQYKTTALKPSKGEIHGGKRRDQAGGVLKTLHFVIAHGTAPGEPHAPSASVNV